MKIILRRNRDASFLVILFMVVVGAVIGGVTNVIAIRMLFHPFKPYYIFKMRIPFTPGLIPKRREEIATKIGQVIEEHLITESVILQKLNEPNTREAINDLVIKQLSKLKVTMLQYESLQINLSLILMTSLTIS